MLSSNLLTVNIADFIDNFGRFLANKGHGVLET